MLGSFDELRASSNGKWVAVGYEKGAVEIFDVETRTLRQLDGPSYDCGGHRLAISNDGKRLYSGAYYETGITAFDVEQNELVWHRRDIKKLQCMTLDEPGRRLYCALEKGASKVLNIDTRREIGRGIIGLRHLYVSPDCQFFVFERKRKTTIETREQEVVRTFPRTTHWLRRARFGEGMVVLSWANGIVEGIDLPSGETRWTYKSIGARGCEFVYYFEPAGQSNAFWMAERPYDEPPWHSLTLVDGDGSVVERYRCGLGVTYCVLPTRDEVVLGDFSVIDIRAFDAVSTSSPA